MGTIKKLGLDTLIASKSCRERDLVLAMIAGRLIACFNTLLAPERKRKRNDLLEATENILNTRIRTVVRRTRTPLPEDAVRSYKRLAQVERVFRNRTASPPSWPHWEQGVATTAGSASREPRSPGSPSLPHSRLKPSSFLACSQERETTNRCLSNGIKGISINHAGNFGLNRCCSPCSQLNHHPNRNFKLSWGNL